MKVLQRCAVIFITISLISGCTGAEKIAPTLAIIETHIPTSTKTLTVVPTLLQLATITPEPTLEVPKLSLGKITAETIEGLTQIKMLGDGRVNDVAFSPGGGLIAVSSSIGIRLHGAQDLIERAFIPTSQAVTRVAFSPNGKLFAAGTQGGRIWVYAVEALLADKATPPKLPKEIKANNFAITCLEFSPDSMTLTSGSLDRTILVWDPVTGKRVRSLGGFLLGISAVAYSEQSDLLAGASVDGSTRIWRIRTGEMLNSSGDADRRRNEVDHYPISLSFAKTEELVTTWADGAITTWDWQSEDSQPVDFSSMEINRLSSSIFNSKLDTLINIHVNGKVDLYYEISHDDGSSSVDEVFETNVSPISSSLSPDGKRLIIISYPSEVSLWDVESKSLLKVYSRSAMGQQIISSAFSPDGKLLATSLGDGLVRIWDTSNMQIYFEMVVSPLETTRTMMFSSDGKQLLCGADAIYIYPAEDFSERLTSQFIEGAQPTQQIIMPSLKIATGGTLQTLALSPDMNVLASANLLEKTVQVWDPLEGTSITNYGGFKDPVEVVAFSPDSQTLAAGSVDHTVYLWSLERLISTKSGGPDLEKPDLIIKNEYPVLSMSYSADGNQLAIAGTNWNVRVVNSKNGGLLFRLKGAKNQITSLAISEDGKLFATGDADGILRIYGSEQGKLVTVLEGHAGMVNTLNFSPDARMLISGGEDGTIRVWGLLD